MTTKHTPTPRIMGRCEWRMKDGICICRNNYHAGEFKPSEDATHVQIHYQAVAFLAGKEDAYV